ncbi:MAG: efflux RND transporter periplasmic adaptor subunit [Acidobacteria bacterium]|nr:efflux RND transporter periplasmic adaptor subunit [Acidobacteriota bacterium]MBU4306431.1 efflux RND transporter periplasmic adaptor subunit [Acidobacteriota bacterium]MBU4404564.1 efflux RND transporter periplasmic adaptor subunit [Acidobacteriota bacterium]MCG2811755.1 efflux RND transporter periplasmic adaptor subunit [Candidatus Aminicenantes bacterium]
MKKIARVVVLIAALAVLIFFGTKYIKSNHGKPEGGGTAKSVVAANDAEVEAAVPVRVTALKRGDLPLRLALTAETEARERAVVKNEVGGVVRKIFRHEGDRVVAGEPIIQLESRESELALRRAEAVRLEAYSKFLSQYKILVTGDGTRAGAMEEKKKQYEAALKKFKKGLISKDEMEKTEDLLLAGMIESGTLQDEVKRCVSGLTGSEVELEKARLDLERTVMRAPFSGTIAVLKAAVGERLAAGSEVFSIVNLASVFLKAFVLETEIAKVKVGQRVRIRFISDPGRPLYGRVTALSPEIDREKKTGTVFIGFVNPGDVRSGLNAEADIEYETVKNVLKIPRQSMLVRSNRTLVFIVENDMALWKYLEAGAGNEEEIEVKAGELNAGDLVVIEGQLTLAHQAKVKIIE